MASIPDDEAAVRLAAILESSEDAIITTDLDSTITSWNNAAEQLYGFDAAEVVGRSILTVFPPDRADEERDILRMVTSGERVRDVDAVRRRRDGRLVPVALTVSPLRSAAGVVVGTLRLARDVSSRQVAERASRRLVAIVESSDDAIVSKDLRGIVTSWNRAAERMFGYSAEEMIGESIRKLIPADRQGEEDHVLSCIVRGEKVDHFETLRCRKDGTLIPISLTVSPIRDDDGHVVGASKIARDISERKESDAERLRLLAAAEQNAAVTEKLNRVGAVVASGLDRNAIVQAVTDAGRDLTTAQFGAFFYNAVDEHGEMYTLYTISGVPRELFSKFPMPRNTAVFDATFRGTAVVRSDDITKDPRYGRNVPYRGMPPGHLPVRSYLAVPVKSRSGEVLGGLFFGHPEPGVFREHHERLATGIASWAAVALENARLYGDIQRASHLKDEFLATLSHELRTPLNAILGYARMMRSGIVAGEKQAKAIATIERNATSLTQIVEDVLDVSRIISGKLRLHVEPVELADVVLAAADSVMPAATAKGITLDTALDPHAGPVSGDPERLQQIVWNLLSNAVKFTERGGHVRATVARVDSHAELAVSDDGIGISKEFLPFIFERFRQADSSATRERGGLGLGLGIARQLVELHGGTIVAESAGPGQGTTFRVRLPVMAVRPVTKGSNQIEHPLDDAFVQARLTDLSGIRILVVDDDRDALQMVREILEAGGGIVETAETAMAALNTIRSWVPDVVVADLGLPRMDGFELISEIRRNPSAAVRGVPAAALTAYARSDDRAKALRSGFQMHLAKPIDPAELMAAVSTLARPPGGAAEPMTKSGGRSG
jgi:PAS domain S-box-containing protein